MPYHEAIKMELEQQKKAQDEVDVSIAPSNTLVPECLGGFLA